MSVDIGPDIHLRRLLALRERPVGRSLMRQRWSNLLFLHRAVAPEVIQGLLPPELTVDTFDGKAWVGFVPFQMSEVRWAGRVAMPTAHTFPETNLRTYVHRDGEAPGVWFFSLDAASTLAVYGARLLYGLPYWRARMSIERRGDEVVYESARIDQPAETRARAVIGNELALPGPGSLEFFLVERYLLYARHRGQLKSGRVHHAPYRLKSVAEFSAEESLSSAVGLASGSYHHALFSEGVDIEAFALRTARNYSL